jgi:hypothetical protein
MHVRSVVTKQIIVDLAWPCFVAYNSSSSWVEPTTYEERSKQEIDIRFDETDLDGSPSKSAVKSSHSTA